MEKIIERFLLPLFVVMSLLYVVCSCGAPIEITKAFHHKSDNALHVERANLAFYFSHDPQMREIKVTQPITEEKERKIFFFPLTTINSIQKDEISSRINECNNFYKVELKEVVKPARGVELIFEYNPQKSFISYDLFDSISLQKGIVFHVYNKNLLEQLETKSNQPILRTLWNMEKPRIVIDSGHGGADTGAIDSSGGKEKDLCLIIGMNVAQLLQEHGFSVVLTRTNDVTILLDNRTTLANNFNADFFVSIHANYAANDAAIGVETFCLQPTLFKNNPSTDISLPYYRAHNYTYHKAHSSYKLAQSIQRHVCEAISCYHTKSIDRKVKFSVAQVLLGTQMPSALVEVGFLSNSKESALLKTEWYQKCIARGICDGILALFAC